MIMTTIVKVRDKNYLFFGHYRSTFKRGIKGEEKRKKVMRLTILPLWLFLAPFCSCQVEWPPMPKFRCLDSYLKEGDHTVSMITEKKSPYTLIEDSGHEPMVLDNMIAPNQFQCEYNPFTFCDDKNEDFYRMPCNQH